MRLDAFRNRAGAQSPCDVQDGSAQRAFQAILDDWRTYSRQSDDVDDVTVLPKSVTFFRWSKQIRINDDKQQLEIQTFDGNRIKVELASGKITEKKKAE